MFANIHALAASVLSEALDQMPGKFADVSKKFREPTLMPEAFIKLDANGDGSVTPAEIMAFNFDNIGTGGAASIPGLTGFLPAVQREMGLGSAGENTSALPGMTRTQLRREAAAHQGSVNFRTAAGISKITSALTGAPVSASLEAYCDGSVNVLLGDGSVRVLSGAFLSDLTAASNDKAMAGPLSYTAPDGSSLQGILIGLFPPPPVVAGRAANGATATAPINLGCIVIAPSGTGIFSTVSGRGVGQINWGDSFQRSVGASFSITPWP